jgi:hypothetical protein
MMLNERSDEWGKRTVQTCGARRTPGPPDACEDVTTSRCPDCVKEAGGRVCGNFPVVPVPGVLSARMTSDPSVRDSDHEHPRLRASEASVSVSETESPSIQVSERPSVQATECEHPSVSIASV